MSDFFPSEHSRDSLLAVQKRVAEIAIAKDDFGELRLIAGVDQAFIEDKIISGIIVLKYSSL